MIRLDADRRERDETTGHTGARNVGKHRPLVTISHLHSWEQDCVEVHVCHTMSNMSMVLVACELFSVLLSLPLSCVRDVKQINKISPADHFQHEPLT